MIHQLNPPIDVSTPLGDATAIVIIDYGLDVNSVWMCRMPGGEPKHFYSDQIRIYDNPMNGKGFDVDKDWFKKMDQTFKDQLDKIFNKKAGDDIVHKLPANAKRNTDFLKKDLPIYYEIGDYVKRTNTYIGGLDDVFNYLRNFCLLKSDKPAIDRTIQIETGSLGITFFNDYFLEKMPGYTFPQIIEYTGTVAEQGFVAWKYYLDPFGYLEIKYDGELDKLSIDNGRKNQGLPMSSAMLKVKDGDKELITFYAVIKDDSCKPTESKEYKPLPDCTYIDKSKIHGHGIFAKTDMKPNRYIGETHFINNDYGPKDGFIRTPLGGFLNHSRTPNCFLSKSNTEKFYVLCTSKDIVFGEELTIDYSINDCGKIYKHCTWI